MSLKLTDFTLKRYGFIAGFCFLFILIIGSIYFYKERIIFADNAFQTFLLIHEKSITIMVNRWPSAVVRFLPLVAVKMGASLSFIMIVFSLSYALFHLIIYTLTRWINTDTRFALTIPVTIALLTGHSFFWCASEILQAITFSVFVLTLVIKFYRSGRWGSAVFIATIGSVILAFYHPQSLICLIFGMVYLLYDEPWKWRDLSFPILCLLVFILKSKLFPNWYDAMKFEGLVTNIQTYKFSILESDSFRDFFQWLYQDMLLYTISFLGVLLTLLVQKKYFKSFLLLFFTLVLLLIYNATNRDSMATYYAEASYMPLAFFVSIPLLFDTLKQNRSGLYILLCVFLLSIVKIGWVSEIYSDRLTAISELTEAHQESRVIIPKQNLPETLKPITWGLPFETLLVTTLSDDSKSKTIVGAATKNEYDKFEGLGQFINGMGNILNGEIDSNYFNLESSVYVKKWPD